MRFVIRSDENPPHEYYVLKSKVIVAGAHHHHNHRQPAQSSSSSSSSSTTTTTTTSSKATPPGSSQGQAQAQGGAQLSTLMSGGSKLAIFFEEASHSKILHDEKLRQMKLTNVVIEHDLGGGQVIMFVRTDAHLLMDVTQSAWFKMIQRRFNLEFVQYLDVLPLQGFWDAEFAWAAAKLGCTRLLPVEKRETHARVKLPQQQQNTQNTQNNGNGSATQGQAKVPDGRDAQDARQTVAENNLPRFVPASSQHGQKSLLRSKEWERPPSLRSDALPSLNETITNNNNHNNSNNNHNQHFNSEINHNDVQTLPGITISKNDTMNQSTVNGIIIANINDNNNNNNNINNNNINTNHNNLNNSNIIPIPNGIPTIVGNPGSPPSIARGTPPTLKRPREQQPLDVEFPSTVVLPSSAAPTPSYYLQHQQHQLTPAKLQQAVTLAMSRRSEAEAEGAEGAEGTEGAEEDVPAATAGGTVQYHPPRIQGPHSSEVSRQNEEAHRGSAAISRKGEGLPHEGNAAPTQGGRGGGSQAAGGIPQQHQQQQEVVVAAAGSVVLPSPQLHSGWKSDISYLCNDSDDDSLFVFPQNDGGNNGCGGVEGDPKVIRVEGGDGLNMFLPPFKVLVQDGLN